MATTTTAARKRIQPTQLFQGYDSFADSARLFAASGTATAPTAVLKKAEIAICKSFDSLQNTLNISASMSASLAGLGSVSEKMNFLHDLKVTNKSVAVVAHATIKSTTTVKTAQLDAGAPTNVRQFVREYGDSYINSITTGAEYYAVYLIQCTTTEEQTEVTNDLTASGIIEGVEVNAELKTSFKTLQTTYGSRVTFSQYMNGMSDLELPHADNIVDFALEFTGRTPDSPGAVISYDASGYEDLAEMPAELDVVTDNRTLFLGDASYEGLAADYAKLTMAANAADLLSRIYATYGYDDPLLNARAPQIQAEKKSLEILIGNVDRDPTKPYERPNLPSLEFGEPQLTVTVQTTEPFGGGSAGTPEPVKIVDRSTISAGILLSSVRARITMDEQDMSQLFHTYISDADDSVFADVTNGTDTNGRESATLALRRDERITDVYVQFIDHVHKIAIATNMGGKFEAPAGTPNPGFQSKQWSAGPDDRFLGFLVRSHDWVRSIAIVYATFAPAEWKVGGRKVRKAA